MSAALQEVLATIDQEIAKLQTARAVVAGLVGPFQQPTVSLEGAVLPSGPMVARVMAETPEAIGQARRPVATNGGDCVRPEQPAASSQQPAASSQQPAASSQHGSRPSSGRPPCPR